MFSLYSIISSSISSISVVEWVINMRFVLEYGFMWFCGVYFLLERGRYDKFIHSPGPGDYGIGGQAGEDYGDCRLEGGGRPGGVEVCHSGESYAAAGRAD